MPFVDIPTAKANLVALLQARPLIVQRDVLVRRGIAREGTPERERISVLRAESATRAPLRVSPVRAETVNVVCLIEAFTTEDDPAIAELQMWTLVDEIDAALAGEHPLGPPWRARLVGASEDDPEALTPGWRAQAAATVVLEAETV